MNPIERKLKNALLPTERDFTHIYRLRRALLQSSFMAETRWQLIGRIMRYYLVQKAVMVPSMVSLVIFAAIFVSIQRAGDLPPELVRNDFKSSSPEIRGIHDTNSKVVDESAANTTRVSGIVTASDTTSAMPPTIYHWQNVTYASADEMNAKILEASLTDNSVLMLNTPQGTFIYSFSPDGNRLQPRVLPTPVAAKAASAP